MFPVFQSVATLPNHHKFSNMTDSGLDLQYSADKLICLYSETAFSFLFCLLQSQVVRNYFLILLDCLSKGFSGAVEDVTEEKAVMTFL